MRERAPKTCKPAASASAGFCARFRVGVAGDAEAIGVSPDDILDAQASQGSGSGSGYALQWWMLDNESGHWLKHPDDYWQQRN